MSIKEKKLEKVIETPMSNDDIKKYLPNANIIAYNDLPKYNKIEDILPYNKSYAVLLYQDSPNSGHWVGLLRYNNVIEFFDSYGGRPDTQLKWVPKEKRTDIGIYKNYLSQLLKKTKLPVIFNSRDHQNDNPSVNTCGRHVVWRILNMLNKDMNLKQYNRFMKATGLPADIIVSERVDRTSE